jgi:hypothetical protein
VRERDRRERGERKMGREKERGRGRENSGKTDSVLLPKCEI